MGETVAELPSRELTGPYYAYLKTVHSISKYVVRHRLQTPLTTPKKILSGPGSEMISKGIGKSFYMKLELTFPHICNDPGRTRLECAEEAKIGSRESQP
jgi:hypothetical protein